MKEFAAGVYVFYQPVLEVNVGLIVGGEAALVVDTLSTDAQAVELLAAVRRVTSLPLQAVNTHHHFDHSFGNAVFAAQGAPIWGQEEAAALLRTRGNLMRDRWCDEYAATEPALATAMATVTVYPPTAPSGSSPQWTWVAGSWNCATSAAGTAPATSSSSCRTPTPCSPAT